MKHVWKLNFNSIEKSILIEHNSEKEIKLNVVDKFKNARAFP